MTLGLGGRGTGTGVKKHAIHDKRSQTSAEKATRLPDQTVPSYFRHYSVRKITG